MKNFRLSLFPNSYKTTEMQPDARGSLQIPLSVINELYQGLSLGTITPKQGYADGENFVELKAAAWKSDGSLTAAGKQRPAISIQIDSPAEQANYDASKAAREATSEFPQAQPQPVAAGFPSQPVATGFPPAQPAFNTSMPF